MGKRQAQEQRAEETKPPEEQLGTSSSPLKNWLVFLGIVVVALIYIATTQPDVRWGGVAAMFVFYAIFYYIGAQLAGSRASTLDDTLVAGRSLPLFVAVFTMTATWVGGGYISGTAEFTFSEGLVWAQAPWGYALSLIVGGIFFAPKMRRGEFRTMMDPIRIRLGQRLTTALYVPALIAEVFWSAAILTALGTMFGTILGLDFAVSIILSAAIAVAYTVIGGMYSVSYTDVIQVALIFVGLVAVLPFAFPEVGGFANAWQNYSADMGSLSRVVPPLTGWDHPEWGSFYWNWWDFMLLLVFGGIPWQVYFQRVLSAKTPSTARWLSILAGFLAILAAIPAVLIGVIGHNVDWTAIGAPEPEIPALVLPYVFRYLTPAVFAALGLGAMAAAVMSSVDSSILSASSMGSWNVYRPLKGAQVTWMQIQRVLRRMIVLIGAAATLIALQVQSVYELWYLASDMVYSILFPQLTCALFFKHLNRTGATAGIVVSLILRLGGGEPTLGLPIFLPYPMVEDGAVMFPFRTLAMLAGLATTLIVSYLTRHRDEPVELSELEPQEARA